MLLDGLGLMAVGMTTVFAFLGILVISMQGLARVALRFPPEDEPEPVLEPARTDDANAEIAVVLAAIEAWRQANAASTGRG